jgi:hypothetical protein
MGSGIGVFAEQAEQKTMRRAVAMKRVDMVSASSLFYFS